LFVFTSVNNQTNANKDLKDTQSIIKALYLYNFATLTDWPQKQKQGSFVIGVLSTDDKVFTQITKKYSHRSIGNQKIKVVKYTTVNSITKTNILFLDKSKSQYISAVNTKLKNTNTMLVTNRTGYLNKGAVINFVVVNNKQSYEVNVKNAKKKKLVLATKLIELATKKIE